MIQLSELTGFDSTQYNALKAKLSAKGVDPVAKVTLRQYAPSWEAITGFVENVPRIDFNIGALSIHGTYVNPDNSCELLSAILPTNSTSWYIGKFWTDSVPMTGFSSAYGTMDTLRENISYYIASNGIVGFTTNFDGGSSHTWHNSTANTVRFVSGVDSDTASAHVLGVNANGNWRLGYCNLDRSDIVWSDIYWPYQVRSFAAARMSGYDVIAMVTDISPLTDVSTSGTKLQITDQRVQGVVLFKFDHATQTWSDHFVVDSCDNATGIAISGVDLYVNGDYVFMTYARQADGVIGVRLSRSSDGLNWENPLFVQDIGSYTSVADVPKFSFVAGNGYMYLASCNRVLRSLATDYCGVINPALVEDITPYTTSISAQINAQRAATVKVTKPDGYSGLLDLTKRMRCVIEFGYWDSTTALTVPLLTGDVETKTTSRELPYNEVTLTVKDTSSLPAAVGSSVAREWEGITFSGDNFAPIIAEDETGSSGLGHVAIKTGTWTGGDKTDTDRGLTFMVDGTEGFAMSTSISRAMCGSFSGEMSFYNRIGRVAKQPGSVPSGGTLQGGETAALAFHALNEHNCWLVMWTPAAGSGGLFELRKRIGTVVNDETSHVTLPASVWNNSVTYDNTYPYTYSGRVTVIWRYSMIRVYRHYPNGTSQQILVYEAKGMGDYDFNAKNPDGTPNYPPLEGGFAGRPFTGGGCAYLAYSPRDGYTPLTTWDGGFEGAFNDNDHDNNWSGSGITVAEMSGILHGNYPYTSGGQVSGIKHSGSYSWKLTSPSTDHDGKRGARVQTATGLNIPSGAILRAKGYVYVAQIDQNGDFGVYLNARAPSSEDKERNGMFVAISETSKWVPFLLTYTTDQTTDFVEILAYVHGSGRTTNTVFHIDDFTIEKYTGTPSYAYFGNVDMNDGLHSFSANDAIDALYAYAGHHHMARHYAMDEAPANSFSAANVDLPYVANFTVTGTSGKIGLCSRGTTPNPIEVEWTASTTKITVLSGTVNGVTVPNGVRHLYIGLPTGKVRVMVTTARNEGTLFKNDQSGVTDWITVAIYANERLHMCHSFALHDISPLGTQIYATTGSISNVKVDELHRQVPFFSVDPGEVVGTGLGRVVGQSRSETLYRFNDTVLFARPTIVHNPANVDWALPLSRTTKIDESETGQIPVHFRLVGAWDELDIFDEAGLYDTWRHIFTRKDDPNLLTRAELETERAYVVYELQSARDRQQIEIAFNPLMERGDYASFDGKYWTIDSVSLSLSTSSEGTLQMSSSLVLNGA
jgi:hypothetical protein